MRISSMRDLLEQTAIDHVYYRTYDPMVRCVGRRVHAKSLGPDCDARGRWPAHVDTGRR